MYEPGNEYKPETNAQDKSYGLQSNDPLYEPRGRKKTGLAVKAIGKTFLALLMVVTISLSSVGGYIWYTDRYGEQPPSTPAYSDSSITDLPSKTSHGTQSPSGDALTTPEIYVKCVPWVVSIISEISYGNAPSGGFFGNFGPNGGTAQASGTGIVMTADGYIITNHHVIENASKVYITVNGGKEYEAKIVGSDEKTDIAVLKIDATGLTPAEFGDSSSLLVGESAFVIGNPLGTNLADTLTHGIISSTERQIQFTDSNGNPFYMTLIQTDAAVNPGNSGGPLINAYGQVIGVVNSKMSAEDVEGIGFAIPAETALSIADDIILNGKVTSRPMLGITVSSLSETQAQQYNEYYKEQIEAGETEAFVPGVIVQSVEDGSDAKKAGLEKGDQIIAFNGVDISTSSELNFEKEKCEIGDTATVTILRGGQQIDMQITFTSGGETA